MSQILFFTPKFGLIEWSNKKALYEFLLANEGKEMYAKIDKVKSVRSLDQNSFYVEAILKSSPPTLETRQMRFTVSSRDCFLPKKKDDIINE
jgi:hypothetical protein